MLNLKPWVFILSLAASLGGGLGLGVVTTRTIITEPANCAPTDVELREEGKPTLRNSDVQNTGRDKGY